ncbi:unnamed protein product [Fusarium equiseti]|uniref:Nephrocystin 3-like N-terminal domain-containing protein n=1 Tax=Fusarium equiseti TaxID=61235 RepID=A0A8J2IQM0_FUSEQ|nr:unnamed protein product [Fusarium equiseti]
MPWHRLVQCCDDDAETAPAPRTSAIVPGQTSASFPADRVSLVTIRPANTSGSPTPSQTLQPSDTIAEQQKAFQELWLKAMGQVKASKDGPELKELIQTQTNSLPEDGDITMPDLFKSLQDEMKRVGLRGKLAEMMEEINLTAGQDIRAKVIQGMAEMSILVYQCSVYQEVHLTPMGSSPKPTKEKLEEAILESFVVSIKFLSFALIRQRSVAKAVTDAWKIEDFSGYLKDLATAKIRLHEAGYMCEIYRGSENDGILKDMYEVVRQEAIAMAEDRAKTQIKGLLINPREAVDHVHYPSNSFCLDGTRVAVLQDIKNWAGDPKSPTVCWLPGLAGTGKSTIARTIARDLKGRSFGAAFFFKKGAGNRGNGRFLFSVIAYQLAINIPPLRQNIVHAVRRDDSSVVAPMDIQWRRLVQEPLVALQNTGFDKPILVAIDALDECEEDDRGEILTLLASCPIALKVFITSRPELDIEGHFAKIRLHREIVLHRVNPGSIKQDINTFIRHAISHFVLEYNRAHPQEHMQLQSDWPGNKKTQLLVSRSSPLFIAAATFIRMIKDRHWTKSPDEKIDFIIEASAKVYSQYDPLYRPVLSLILSHSPEDDHSDVTRNFTFVIGSFLVLANPLSVTSLANLLNVEPRVMFGQIDPLRSVIDVPSDDSPIRLFHLSFRDYLVSKSAGDFQVSETKAHRTLAIKCIELMRRNFKQDMCEVNTTRSSVCFLILGSSFEAVSRFIPRWGYHYNILSEFRHNLFLTWIEVLWIIGKADCFSAMISELRALARGDGRAKMDQFCQDATDFVRYFHNGIKQAPLQLYTSGIMFAPKLSTAPQTFDHRQYPEWISGPCNGNQVWPGGQEMIQNDYICVRDIIFLPNGRLMSVKINGLVEIWDPASGRCLETLSLDPKDGSCSRIFSSKNSKIAFVTIKGIRIWDLDNRYWYPEVVPTRLEDTSLAFSDDGELLCVPGSPLDCEAEENAPVLQIWDLESKKVACKIRSLPNYPALSLQGQWMACKRSKSLIVSQWNRHEDISWDVLECEGVVWSNFSTDGTLIASLHHDSTVSVWSLNAKQCLYKFNHKTRKISLTSKILAIRDSDYYLNIVDLETGLMKTWDLSAITSVNNLCHHGSPVRWIAPIADDNTVISATYDDVKIWDVNGQVCKETCEVRKMMPAADSQCIASAKRAPYFVVTTGRGIEIWQIAPLYRKELIEIQGGLSCLSISDDGQRLVTALSLRAIENVEIWDLKTSRRTVTLTVEGRVLAIALSAEGSKVIIHSHESLEVWKLPDTQLWKIPTGYILYNIPLALHDRRIMCCHSGVNVWNVETGKLLLQRHLGNQEPRPIFHESFFNFSSIADPVDSNHAVFKPFYLTTDGEWVFKDGKRVVGAGRVSARY